MKSQPQDFSSPFTFILSCYMQCLFYLVRQTFIFSNESLFLCLTEGKGLYIYIYTYLYNNLSYARILIGSILRSIGGQTYRLRHH